MQTLHASDIYFKKIVTLKRHGQTLRFRVSQDLFSSFQVDIGTQFLLRTLDTHGPRSFGKALDMGCGYGPLGLALQQNQPQAVVHMVDRDALAVDFARQNADLNGLSQAVAYGSLGYDDVPDDDFDLIVSNIPAKAGEPVIAHLLRHATHHLQPGGVVAVVVVTPIAERVAAVLAATPDIRLTLRQDRPGHAALHYQFTRRPDAPPLNSGFAAGLYQRADGAFTVGKARCPMRLMHGLAEFESPGFATQLLLDALAAGDLPPRSALIFNAGQGYVPVALWRQAQPDHIWLADRDLLALRSARQNLQLNGCPVQTITLSHQTGIGQRPRQRFDLIAGVLRGDEGPEAAAQLARDAAAQLAEAGQLWVAGGSTAVTRLADVVQSERLLTVAARRRWRGHSLLTLTPRGQPAA